jgi:hypothetical protein
MQTVEFRRETQIKSTTRIGVFVAPPKKFIFALLVAIDFFGKPEVNPAFEELLKKEQRFIRIVRRSQACESGIAMFLAYGLETFVNRGQQIDNHLLRATRDSVAQSRPSFKSMKAEPAFIAQPAFIHFDVAPSDSPVDLAIGCRVTRNTSSNGTRRMIDTQIATRAAAGTDGRRVFQKPYTYFETKVHAG